MVYLMLTGELPFYSKDVGDILAMHLRDKPPPIDAMVEGLCPGIADLVTSCLSKKPEGRPSSALALLSQYKLALSALGESQTLPLPLR
jgi:serine/threonine-protein kinase